MIDNRTAHKDWPLPHKSNDLIDDVQRLRATLIGIDEAVYAGEVARTTLRTEVDESHLVARNALRTAIDTEHGAAMAALRTELLGKIADSVALPVGLSVTTNPAGQVTQTVETFADAHTRTTTIAYHANGNVNTVTIVENGKTRTESYSYDASGTVTGMTATEV